MKRTEFIRKVVHLTLWGLLAWLAIFLGRKATTDNRCKSCPEYASCTDKRRCKYITIDQEG
jgi:hypothetical protein